MAARYGDNGKSLPTAICLASTPERLRRANYARVAIISSRRNGEIFMECLAIFTGACEKSINVAVNTSTGLNCDMRDVNH